MSSVYPSCLQFSLFYSKSSGSTTLQRTRLPYLGKLNGLLALLQIASCHHHFLYPALSSSSQHSLCTRKQCKKTSVIRYPVIPPTELFQIQKLMILVYHGSKSSKQKIPDSKNLRHDFNITYPNKNKYKK
jgi:hypothetical protein